MSAEVSRHSIDPPSNWPETWRPDLVVFSPMQGAGPLAAQVARCPPFAHTIGSDQPAALWTLVAKHLTEE